MRSSPRAHMYKRTNDVPPLPYNRTPRILSDAEHVHRALFVRSNEIRAKRPNVEISDELQDQEPRGILRISEAGKLIRVEFFESTFSADQLRFLEEYVQAARECGDIALMYPGLSFPEDYVIRKVEEVMDRAYSAGVKDDISVHGYLYDFDGQPREVV